MADNFSASLKEAELASKNDIADFVIKCRFCYENFSKKKNTH